ncbi:hypothetical protein J2X90_002905 [Variovorax paradoxus]|nr:hypothetical protein [Variovorax paradoxus]MDP9931487.1 hypothetical protein [Variovorax paradoxus]MDQ0025099.1 hypothetical protein [Variovorax paradoxus]
MNEFLEAARRYMNHARMPAHAMQAWHAAMRITIAGRTAAIPCQ